MAKAQHGALVTLATTLAEKLDMGSNGQDLFNTLKATAFRGDVSNEQMTALLVVANQYGLNPWTKEIYAFPDKHNGIVPVVGVDGWARIINSHPQFDGMEFEQDDASCTCIIYRKDRSRAIKVTEWLSECKRGTAPWQSHPRRMLRHKAMIQCARLAFGYGGIFDQDEAEVISEHHMGDVQYADSDNAPAMPPPASEPAAYPQEDFNKYLPKWAAMIKAGKATADRVIAMAGAKAPLTDEQKNVIRSIKPDAPARNAQADVTDVEPKPVPAPAPAPASAAEPPMTYAQVADLMLRANTLEALEDAAAYIARVADASQRTELADVLLRRGSELDAASPSPAQPENAGQPEDTGPFEDDDLPF